MTGVDELLVTLYADTIGIILSFGLMVLSARSGNKNDWEMRFFRFLLIWNMILGLVNSVTYCAEHQAFGSSGRTVAIITETGLEVMLALIVLTWFLYVDYSMFLSIDHLKLRIKYWLIPIYIVFLLLAINLFTGIVFVYDENVVYHPTAFYYVQISIKYLYVLVTFVIIWVYKKKQGKLRFVNIWDFAVPGLLGAILTNVTPYSFMCLSLSVAFTMIYFSQLNGRCYVDIYTGFYNKSYLDNLLDLYEKKKFNFNSGILFEFRNLEDKDIKPVSDILKEELPDECETVRINKNRYLSLTNADRKSSIMLLSEGIEDMVGEWNENNKGKLEVAVSYLFKEKDEDAKTFVERLTKKS